jgi:hypothetical protein
MVSRMNKSGLSGKHEVPIFPVERRDRRILCLCEFSCAREASMLATPPKCTDPPEKASIFALSLGTCCQKPVPCQANVPESCDSIRAVNQEPVQRHHFRF